MMSIKNYDFYKHYNFCESKQIIFSFQGKISDHILQNIIAILEDKFNDYNVEKSCLKRIISIIIELTQNIQRYSFRKTINKNQENGHGMLVVRKTEEGFWIHAGNLLAPENGEKLIHYCNQFITLNQESLKEMYQKKLTVKRAGASDKAGLGLLYILRKSNSRMKIKSYRVDDSHVFLTFSILVN